MVKRKAFHFFITAVVFVVFFLLAFLLHDASIDIKRLLLLLAFKGY